MNRSIFLSLLSAILSVAIVPAWSDQRKPTRSECISGVTLDWKGNETFEEREAILRQMSGRFTKHIPTSGLAIREQKKVYVIFRDLCREKDEMMREIMQIYKQNIPKFPDYKLITRNIEPSPQTILSYGDVWSDGAVSNFLPR